MVAGGTHQKLSIEQREYVDFVHALVAVVSGGSRSGQNRLSFRERDG